MCEKKVDGACRAVCRVIAQSFSEELLKSYITRASRSDNEVEALTLAYRQAPTKSLKTQILSIYQPALYVKGTESNTCAL